MVTVCNKLFSANVDCFSPFGQCAGAAFWLCNLSLKMNSRKFVFINSCKPEERFGILRLRGNETLVFNNLFDQYILKSVKTENLK